MPRSNPNLTEFEVLNVDPKFWNDIGLLIEKLVLKCPESTESGRKLRGDLLTYTEAGWHTVNFTDPQLSVSPRPMESGLFGYRFRSKQTTEDQCFEILPELDLVQFVDGDHDHVVLGLAVLILLNYYYPTRLRVVAGHRTTHWEEALNLARRVNGFVESPDWLSLPTLSAIDVPALAMSASMDFRA